MSFLYSQEHDFNSVVISRKATYLKNCVQYIKTGTYKPKKGPKQSIDERFKLLLDSESTVKKVISLCLKCETKDLKDDFEIEKQYRTKILGF